MPRTARRPALVIAGLTITLVAVVMAGVMFGAVPVSLGDIAGAMGRGIAGRGGTGVSDALVLGLRIPRVLLAALVGACLSGAGVLYQALFKNALADPYILGVSSGAGLGAVLALAFGGVGALAAVLVPASAFVGATLTMLLVVAIASRAGRLETLSLLLAGVAVSYTLAALTSFAMVVRRETMARIVFWMMGGLQAATWQYVAVVGVMLVAGLALPLAYSRELDIILLGDERAGQLGVNVKVLERMVLASASLMVAAAVSVAGLIGFVGLMTPHMTRLVLGPRHRLLLPASVIAGAIVMVLADLLARVVLAPIELPVGIVTALAGGPVFVWLLMRDRRRSL